MKWRVGRKIGRTIYNQLGSEPSDEDPVIGMLDTPELAAIAVKAVNAFQSDYHHHALTRAERKLELIRDVLEEEGE